MLKWCLASALITAANESRLCRADPAMTARNRVFAHVDALPSGTELRVGIASSGRFHLLDLARELNALGVNVRFYSYVPRKRAEAFGLPRHCHVALLPLLF